MPTNPLSTNCISCIATKQSVHHLITYIYILEMNKVCCHIGHVLSQYLI